MKELKAIIQLVLKLTFLISLFPLRIFKLKKNRIFLLNSLLSLEAKYSCNTKYIAEYILEK